MKRQHAENDREAHRWKLFLKRARSSANGEMEGKVNFLCERCRCSIFEINLDVCTAIRVSFEWFEWFEFYFFSLFVKILLNLLLKCD